MNLGSVRAWWVRRIGDTIQIELETHPRLLRPSKTVRLQFTDPLDAADIGNALIAAASGDWPTGDGS